MQADEEAPDASQEKDMPVHRGFIVGHIARRTLAACMASGLIASMALAPLFSAHGQTTAQPQVQIPQAQADSQPWPGPPITAQTTDGDPPARVGRIAKINGTVSFHTADEDQWGPATLNYPLTAGNTLWTEPDAHAELQIGSSNRLVMDSSTELNIVALDDNRFEADLPQGAAYLNVPNLPPDNSHTIRTPRGIVKISQSGRYVIVAGDDDKSTSVTALAGSAQLDGHGLTQTVPAGQTATLSGPLDSDEPIKAALAPMQQNHFMEAVLAEEKPQQITAPAPTSAPVSPYPNIAQNAWPPQQNTIPDARIPVGTTVAMPSEVQGMTGAQDLATYGTWSRAPTYGTVWYPPVETGWVPYRNGHWAYIEPWGWTWVADEPWGFAPFHYGRWVTVHGRWAWSPGIPGRSYHRHYRPVYSPALVAFFGSGNSVSVSIGIGSSNIGWVPLGWHEPYYPPYRVSRNYIRNVNVTHVTNITRVTNLTQVNNVTVNQYVNHNSVTVVSASAMRESRPIQRSIQTVDRRQITNMHSEHRPEIRPTADTAGMSPQSARRMGISENRDTHRQAAPGPRIRPEDLRHNETRQPHSIMANRNNRNSVPVPRQREMNQLEPGQPVRTDQAHPIPSHTDAVRIDQRMARRQRAQQVRPQGAGQDSLEANRQHSDPARPEIRKPEMQRQQVQQQEYQHREMQRRQAEQHDRQRLDIQRQKIQRQETQQRQQAEQRNRQHQDTQRQQVQQQRQEIQRQQHRRDNDL